jgi:hypothetical protein
MLVYISRYPGKRSKRTEQTIRVRIDPYDTWNMDTTLANIILPMLKQLKETKHGVAHVDEEDVPEEMRRPGESASIGPDDDANFEHLKVKWEWALDEMIWAFEQKLIDWEQQYYSGEHDLLSVCANPEAPKKDQMFEIQEGPNDTFTIDMDGMTAHQKRMTNGFRLFGKMYEALWD